MKKTYIKPDAEYVSFYSEEDITDVMTLAEGEAPSGYLGEGDNSEGWS